MSLPFLEQEREQWYMATQNTSSRLWFAVVSSEENTLIAETGFQRYDSHWRTADLTLIVGNKQFQGDGYGTEILHEVLNYGFGVLNLHRIAVGIVGFNARALGFYKNAGFVEEGRQREGYYYDHEYHDFVMMSLLESEFRQ
jgi:RimJ/RimL family protein N-acetyltransferase